MAGLGLATSIDWTQAVTNFHKTINQMSRQSTRTFISPANSDIRPESRCGKYADVCSERLSKMFKSEIQFQHTVESARKAVEFGLKTGLIRRTAQAHDYRDELQELGKEIVSLRRSVGWSQHFTDRQFGYKSHRTSRFEAGYNSHESTKRFLEHLKKLVAHEQKHAKMKADK